MLLLVCVNPLLKIYIVVVSTFPSTKADSYLDAFRPLSRDFRCDSSASSRLDGAFHITHTQ